jgi:hypothetical protein
VDQVYQACAAEDQEFGSDCWIIDAGITASFISMKGVFQADSNVTKLWETPCLQRLAGID